jgi:hypothetical protein
MERRNCWEVIACGREPGGEHVEDRGVCPAAMPSEYDGLHGGTHAGRFCWIVAGPDCESGTHGCMAQTLHHCIHCQFLKQVNEEEGSKFALTANRAKGGSR